MQGTGRVGIFPDLAAARTKSVEAMNQVVGTREKFVGRSGPSSIRSLTPDERKQLDQLAILRDGYERQASNLPTTDEGLQQHERTMKDRFGDLDRQVSEMNVEIQSLEAQLVAIEQYYRVSRSEQKIRPEDIEAPVQRHAHGDRRAAHHARQGPRGDRRRHPRGERGRLDRRGRARGGAETFGGAACRSWRSSGRPRGAPDRRPTARRSTGSTTCSPAATPSQASSTSSTSASTAGDVRLATVKRYLAAEKEELAQAGEKLGGIVDESKSLGGGLAQAMFTQGRRQVLRPGRSLGRRHHRRLLGAQGREDPGGHQADQPQEPGAQGARRGLQKVMEDDK